MSKLFAKVAGFFRSRTQVGMDKAGNRYFSRVEEIDGLTKEKRYVIFKGEEDPTSIPVEWICWLNGQRKKPPTPQEMVELEAKRELIKLNVALLKKEEEERKSKISSLHQRNRTSKDGGPNLRSFIQQFPGAPSDQQRGSASEDTTDEIDDTSEKVGSSEPTGSGQSFKPGTWQPPT